MPFVDEDTARIWRRAHKRKLRARWKPLHKALGIKTQVVEAISIERYGVRRVKITLPAV